MLLKQRRDKHENKENGTVVHARKFGNSFGMMIHQRDPHKIQVILFIQRLCAYLLVLKCLELLSTKFKG